MPDQPASDLSALLAGERVEVQLLDASRHMVFVRALPARIILTDYLALIENEAAMLEKVCAPLPGGALPAGWVDALTDDSHAALVEKASQLNFDRAAVQAERQAKLAQGLIRKAPNVTSLMSSFATSPSPR